MLTDIQIDPWRLRWQEVNTDSNWVASNQARDDRRIVVQQEILDLLNRFLSGEIKVETVKSTFDRKTRTDWDVFGLKGMSGAMFLNKLVKHVPDSEMLAAQLKSALRLPDSPEAGKGTMRKFMGFLDELIGTGVVAKRELSPGFAPFFLSAWWHMQDTEQWPVFYISGRQALERTGLYVSSQDLVKDYFVFRDSFLALGKALNLKSWDLEHLLVWFTEQNTVSPGPEPGRNNKKGKTASLSDPEEPEGEENSDFSHAQIQWLLAKIGQKLGCRVWIAANDRTKEWNGERLGDLSIQVLPPLGMDQISQRIISLIDVLWLKGANRVTAAFEVEQTTSIYSGLLRLSDLTAVSPNLNFPLYIAAPEVRLEKVKRELSRPTFQSLELHKQCGFFSFESLIREFDAILHWATDPSAIERLAAKIKDVSYEDSL